MIDEKVFGGKYQIIKQLGSGGMSTVYLARNVKLSTLWAVKVGNKKQNEKFDLLAEPNIMKNLNHHGIARIFDILEDEENIYIIEDYVEGVSLEEEIHRAGKFNEKQTIEWAKQIADALIYLHQQKPNPIIYRDMKPSNLMLGKDGKVNIIDFGIAREYKKESQSDTTYVGTRGYAAPEQYGTAQTDERTDIYSFGVTLYHLLTGKSPNEPPYEILPIRQLEPSLSTGLEYIIRKCTQLNPNERYQSVALLLHDFSNIHKLNSEYKKQQIFKIIQVGIFLGLLGSFTYLTRTGFIQLKQEKLDDFNATIKKGQTLEIQKQYEQAIETFKLANQKMPQKIDGYREIALSYLKEAQYDTCIQYLEKEVLSIIAEAGQNPDIQYILGTAYFENLKYDYAAVLFEKTSKLAPSIVEYQRDWAVSLARDGKLEQADMVLNSIKNLTKSEEVTWYVSGEIALARKKFDEAIKDFQECLKLTQDENLKTKAYISIAQTYKNNKNAFGNQGIDQEIATLEKANTDLGDKNNIVINEMLGEAYYEKALTEIGNSRTDHFNKAADTFSRLISWGYKRPYIFRNIAVIYQQLGDYTKSEAMLLEMRTAYPEDYTSFMQLALLYAEIENRKPNEQRNYQRTLDNYQLALKYSPEGEKNVALQPLINLINELKTNKWI